MSKKEFLYSREYESDEVGYRITITTTDYSLYNAVKKYAEYIFNAKEADDIEHKSFECCSCGERKGGDTSLPSADAVEVVRCKDCYHAEDDITHMFCVYFHHKVYGDDYCSNAVKRREDGEA